MSLYEAMRQILQPWAYDDHGDSVRVARENIAFTKAHLIKHGLGYVRVYAR